MRNRRCYTLYQFIQGLTRAFAAGRAASLGRPGDGGGHDWHSQRSRGRPQGRERSPVLRVRAAGDRERLLLEASRFGVFPHFPAGRGVSQWQVGDLLHQGANGHSGRGRRARLRGGCAGSAACRACGMGAAPFPVQPNGCGPSVLFALAPEIASTRRSYVLVRTRMLSESQAFIPWKASTIIASMLPATKNVVHRSGAN